MARHARPNTWFALKAAHARLVEELAAERYARFDDQLEIAHGVGLVDELSAQRDEALRELAVTRRELQQAREFAAQPDPYVQMLARETTELRAIVAEQQRTLSDLTNRLMDLLDRAAPPQAPTPPAPAPAVATTPPPAVAASPPPSATPRPVAPRPVPAAPVADRPPVPAGRGGWMPAPPSDGRPEESGPPVLILVENTTDA